MENHVVLQEQYNDALFEMLMDDFASNEGALYIKENERLMQDSSSSIPPETERRILQLIERETAKASRQRSAKFLMKWLGRLAIAALIAAMLFGAAYALSPVFRASTLNLLTQINERVSVWRLMDIDSEDKQSDLPKITIGWLPEEYSASIPEYYNPQNVVIECKNEIGESILITVHSDINAMYALDVEDADYYSNIQINSYPGVVVEKKGLVRVAWADNTSGLVCIITSSDVDSGTLLCIANNISIIQ